MPKGSRVTLKAGAGCGAERAVGLAHMTGEHRIHMQYLQTPPQHRSRTVSLFKEASPWPYISVFKYLGCTPANQRYPPHILVLYKCLLLLLLLLHVIKRYTHIHTTQNFFARVIERCVCACVTLQRSDCLTGVI